MSLLLILTLLGAIDGETGALRIQSQPEVEVLWEGVSLGITDPGGSLTVSDIPPGTFTLSLRKPGFRDYQKSITIKAGTAISLKATLEPATGSRAPTAKPPKTKSPESPKRAESAKADHGHRLNEMLKPAPKEGPPLPVWPAASRPASEASGQNVPIWPFVLVGTLLIVVVWLSRKLKPAAFSRSPALLTDADVLQPSQPVPRTAAFLSDLKKREELLEQGVEIVPERAKGPVIDLDSGSVREVEEQ